MVSSVDPSASVATVAPPSVAETIVPSVPASDPVATAKPPKTPKPPKSATPSQPTGPAMANLIITKFITDAEQIVAGAHTNARVTVKNDGTADAAPFDIGVGYGRDDGLGVGGYSPVPVDGLAAGESVQVTVSISLDDAGAVTFTATADSGDVITESNEDDNSSTLSKTAVSLPNLAWGAKAFAATPYPGGVSGYDLDYDILNTGTADVTQIIAIEVAYSSADGTTGTFGGQYCCDIYQPPVLGAGKEQTHGVGIYNFPRPGTYSMVATLDPDNAIAESNETDNVTTYTVVVP